MAPPEFLAFSAHLSCGQFADGPHNIALLELLGVIEFIADKSVCFKAVMPTILLVVGSGLNWMFGIFILNLWYNCLYYVIIPHYSNKLFC